MSELLRLAPAFGVAVLLVVMWRSGFRGEAFRIVASSFTLFTGSRAAHVTSGFPSFLVMLTSAVVCAVIIFRRPRSAAQAGEPSDR